MHFYFMPNRVTWWNALDLFIKNLGLVCILHETDMENVMMKKLRNNFISTYQITKIFLREKELISPQINVIPASGCTA